MTSIAFLLSSFAWTQAQANSIDYKVYAQNGNIEARLRLTDTSSFRLLRFDNPSLDLLESAVGFLVEDEKSLASFGVERGAGRLSLAGSSAGGMIYMPGYEGYSYIPLARSATAKTVGAESAPIARQEIERSLALASYKLRASYALDLPVAAASSIRLGLTNEAYARLALSLYDIAPIADYLGVGRSLSEAFADYYTGMSFSRFKDSARASFGLRTGALSIEAFGRASSTDLLYADYGMGIGVAAEDRLTVEASYDFASYKSYNFSTPERVSLKSTLKAGPGGSLATEASYGLGEGSSSGLSFALSLKLSLPASGGARAAASSGIDTSPLRGFSESSPRLLSGGLAHDAADGLADGGRAEAAAGVKGLSDERASPADFRWMRVSQIKVKEVDQDIHALLSLRGRSFHDVVSILYTYRSGLDRYDYSRVLDILSPDRLLGKDPSSFLDQGGICVDAARFVATVLDNNGNDTKVVLIQGLSGSPHSFAVSRVPGGSYYAVDGIYYAKRMEGASSFAAAAALYAGGFTQMVLRDVKGGVDQVFVSPDAAMLDSLGMSERAFNRPGDEP